MDVHKDSIRRYLKSIDIEIDGSRPHDVRVYDDRVFGRVYHRGTLALAESYIDGWWDTDDLALLCEKVAVSRGQAASSYFNVFKLDSVLLRVIERLINRQRLFAQTVARHHYDIEPDLYESMLGPTMQYTTGLWEDAFTGGEANSLVEAQHIKYHYIVNELGLEPGSVVYDCGCGWGDFVNYLAIAVQAEVIGVTNSCRQYEWCRENKSSPLVQFVYSDYQSYKPKQLFDAVVATGMLEHVGPKNYRHFFTEMRSVMKSGGRMCLETSVSLNPTFRQSAWFDKYIFPCGILPVTNEIFAASEKHFAVESVLRASDDYVKTLEEWSKNFETQFATLSNKSPKYDTRFYRMWKFYLAAARASFVAQVCDELFVIFRAK